LSGLVEMTDWNGVTSFELDLLGRITSVNDHSDDVVSYTYDEVGNQTSITYPDGTTASYEYDLLGRLTKMTDSEAKNTVYAYDAASQLVQMNYPNGWKEYYEYDAAGQQTRILDINPKGWLTKAVAMEYWYDAQGNVIKEYKRGA
jgi:YD repeat-containing protein